MDELNKALHTSFIDKSFPSNKDLRPKLFFNDYKRRMNLAFELTTPTGKPVGFLLSSLACNRTSFSDFGIQV